MKFMWRLRHLLPKIILRINLHFCSIHFSLEDTFFGGHVGCNVYRIGDLF